MSSFFGGGGVQDKLNVLPLKRLLQLALIYLKPFHKLHHYQTLHQIKYHTEKMFISPA